MGSHQNKEFSEITFAQFSELQLNRQQPELIQALFIFLSIYLVLQIFCSNFAAQNRNNNCYEHEPIHVHVTHKGCRSIFELIMDNGVLTEIRVREMTGEEPLSYNYEQIVY